MRKPIAAAALALALTSPGQAALAEETPPVTMVDGRTEQEYCLGLARWYRQNPEAHVFDGWPDHCYETYGYEFPHHWPSTTTSTTSTTLKMFEPEVLAPAQVQYNEQVEPAPSVTINPTFTG